MHFINSKITDYQFEQLVYLIEKNSPEQFNTLNFMPHTAITFPGSDVHHIEKDKQNNITLMVRFMGLMGVDSPLPSYFNMLTLNDSESAERWRHYLGILTSHQYRLFYQAWRHNQLNLNAYQTESSYRRYLSALSGGLFSHADKLAFSQIGHLMRGKISLSDLMVTLRHFLPQTDIHIADFQPHIYRVKHKATLGKERYRLGDNALLGYQMINETSNILITIKPHSTNTFIDFLPNAQLIQRIQGFLQQALPVYLNYRIHIRISTPRKLLNLTKSVQLYLGWTTFLGEGRHSNYLLKLTCQRGHKHATF